MNNNIYIILKYIKFTELLLKHSALNKLVVLIFFLLSSHPIYTEDMYQKKAYSICENLCDGSLIVLYFLKNSLFVERENLKPSENIKNSKVVG